MLVQNYEAWTLKFSLMNYPIRCNLYSEYSTRRRFKRWVQPRPAFTLIELLVVIAVIGILMALLMPAVQMVREAARRTNCLSNLKQLSIATTAFHDVQRRFPPGYTFPAQAMWSAYILPFMEQGNLYRTIALDGPWQTVGSSNALACATLIPEFRCPSSDAPESMSVQGFEDRVPSSVLACASGMLNRESGPYPWVGDDVSDGIFYRNSQTRMRDIRDGTSHTILLGEALFDYEIWGDDYFGQSQVVDHWYIGSGDLDISSMAHGDRSIEVSECLGSTGCRINSTSIEDAPVNDKELCFSSRHPGGAQVAFADGHLRFVSNFVDFEVWQALGSRAGGEVNHQLD